MRWLVFASLFAATIESSAAMADTPCDFKGIAVGDKLSPTQAMAVLGVKQFKIGPDMPSKEFSKNLDKLGIEDASAFEDWKVGPRCDDARCVIPYGVTVGNDGSPVKVYVAFRDGLVTEMDIFFNKINWTELLPVINNKYGDNWEIENTKETITDLKTQNRENVDRIFMTHKSGGMNRKTGDKCTIWATNYDTIFMHHDPLGVHQSEMVIKLVSRNF